MKPQIRSAFTLIEIMVVVAIIGMLAAIAIPSISQAIKTARQKACAINRKSIDAAKLRWALETQQPETATPRRETCLAPSVISSINPIVRRAANTR